MECFVAKRSSNIAKMGYDDGNLIVTFKNGGVYQYDKVPHKLYESMESLDESESLGRYFLSNVRDKYLCTKLRNPIRIHK